MKSFVNLTKLKKGDRVAIISPSFAAPGKWPWVYELGLKRLKEDFGLIPVEFPTTKKIGASKEERAADLISAFESKEIKAVISTIGGNDQVTYIKNLPSKPFTDNPKPFFGFSDNTHLVNFLWLNGIPSFYGGALFTQFAEQVKMNEFTVKYLRHALFDNQEFEIKASDRYNDIGLNWDDKTLLNHKRLYEENDGWFWNGSKDAVGISWGGCVECIDELLRHDISIPNLADFENIILLAETSEEIPSADYVYRVFRALGEREILKRIKGVLIGRPKAWMFDKQNNKEQKEEYRKKQRETILGIVRQYNQEITVVQNLDFGHTDPQIPMPYGMQIRLDAQNRKIFAAF
jgi:muramoyltetrapeptide carboxypeptidase LdcA involved in peptidoglycan recycling